MMAALYDVDIRAINEHIKKVYGDHVLSEEATIRNFRIVQTGGYDRSTENGSITSFKGTVISGADRISLPGLC